jgi:hypothetical protein
MAVFLLGLATVLADIRDIVANHCSEVCRAAIHGFDAWWHLLEKLSQRPRSVSQWLAVCPWLMPCAEILAD